MNNNSKLTREMLLKSKEFWLELMRNMMLNEVEDYLTEMNISRKELADKLGYTRGYISQILNGNCNLSFEKLAELAVAINKAPYLYLKDMDAVKNLDSIGKSIFIDFEELERKSDRCDVLEEWIESNPDSDKVGSDSF